MKNLFKYTYLLAAAAFLALSCQKEVEDVYVPAAPDAEDCFGVYFPVQDASGSHELDPVDPTEVTISVARKNTSGAVTVPVELSSETEGIFSASELKFADGQAESSFKISFPKAEPGVTYSVTAQISGAEYASNYNAGATSLTYSVTRVKWNLLGTGKWREDILAGTMSSYVSPLNPVWEVTVYERDDKPGMFRIYDVYTDKQIEDWLKPDFKQYRDSVDPELMILLDASNPKKAWIKYTCVGWQFYTNGQFYIGSRVAENVDVIGTNYISDANYGTYENGIVTFPLKALCYGFAADDWWGYGNTNEMFYFAIPGATPVDYSLKLKSNLTENGLTPIDVTVGMDVEEVKYAVYEGSLNAAQAANKVNAIVAGTDASESFKDFTPNATGSAKLGTMGVSASDTGVYTLVAVAYDAKGNAQNSANVEFTYVSAESPVPVVINCGLESSGKYAAYGLSTDNCLEFYIYGEDIESAKVGLFKALDIKSKGWGVALSAVAASDALPAAAIEKINDKGYVDAIAGLVPGTEYYLVVWASNGYEDTFIASDSCFTTGEPLPIYQDYDIAGAYEDGILENAAAWCKDWNYYAVDFYGSLGMREYFGQVKISASTTPTEGPDKYGLYDEYVLLDGLFPHALADAAEYGYDLGDGKVEMDVYDGFMYSFSGNTFDGKSIIQTFAKAAGKWYNGVSYYSAFVPVADGYYAFVDAAASAYNFCGLRIVLDYVWDAMYDLLLVDPAKDDNPKNINAAVSAAQKRFAEAASEIVPTGNYKEDMHNIIDRYNSKTVFNHFAPAGIKDAQHDGKQVKVSVVSVNRTQSEEAAPAAAPGKFAPVRK